ncbi:four-helix bundle copper-binding protein [Kribbella sp. NPDC004138]
MPRSGHGRSARGVAELRKCIRTDLDCADICLPTERVLSRGSCADACRALLSAMQ